MSIQIKILSSVIVACLCSSRRINDAIDTNPIHEHAVVRSMGLFDENENIPLVQKGSTIMLLGDSLAVGLGSHFHKVSREVGYKPVSYSKSGTTTIYWLRQIERLLSLHKPKLVLVSLGTNDSYGVGPNSPTSNTFAMMSDIIAKSGAIIVWIAPPDIKKEKIKKIQDVRRMIMSAVPCYFPSEKFDIPLIDGIHTTGKGYSSWMSELWHWMSMMNIVHPDE